MPYPVQKENNVIDTKELRRLAQAATPRVGHACKYQDAHWLREGHVDFENADLFIASERPQEDAAFYAASNPSAVIELLDRLEAAEKEVAHIKEVEFPRKMRAVAVGWEKKCARLEQERDALRAKIAAMEQQVPVAWQTRTRPAWNDGTWGAWRKCSEEYAEDIKKTPSLHDWLYEARALYALPGAHPAPNAVAYLDIGAGGYMDIGTDLTDEELATLPKGRHMLGVIGTYGVDGYVPAHKENRNEQ